MHIVQTRVSALMTNAPYILNVDCDMYVNNPKIAQHALCIFLDSKGEKEVAFVQCPQRFYDTVKDDAYGNQLVALPMVCQVIHQTNLHYEKASNRFMSYEK